MDDIDIDDPMKLPVSAFSTVLCRALYTKGLRLSLTMIGRFRVIAFAVTCSDLLGSNRVDPLWGSKPHVCLTAFVRDQNGKLHPSGGRKETESLSC